MCYAEAMKHSTGPSDPQPTSNSAAADENEGVVLELSTQLVPAAHRSTLPAVSESAGEQPVWLTEQHLRLPRRRRVALPVALFLITCLSTFYAGVTQWQPHVMSQTLGFRRATIRNWDDGLLYMTAVIAILLSHEMGHFIATLRYRVPASLPFFIPFPITPIGTMGAVIAMDGQRADRRGIFDIGLAGPIAGLVVAIPVLWYGVLKLDFGVPVYGGELYHCPLLIQWMIDWLHPEHASVDALRTSQLNPCFMAGWVGLLITGLNMMPVGQLDGGHVIYTLFGKRAHWMARGFVMLAIVYVVFWDALIWTPMVVLVILIGTDHPRTANDRVPLGRFRYLLGLASLAIPIVCFPLQGMTPISF